jgi:hypothetical protein
LFKSQRSAAAVSGATQTKLAILHPHRRPAQPNRAISKACPLSTMHGPTIRQPVHTGPQPCPSSAVANSEHIHAHLVHAHRPSTQTLGT